MFKKFSFWIWGLITFQLLTAVFHSLSFFVSPVPANESEKQLHELMYNYKKDMGAGISRSFADIFLSLSVSFTLICLLGGLINWYLQKKQISFEIWKGLLLIETIVFGILFFVMLRFTFLPPIICTAMIFIFSSGSWITVKSKS
jgi:hypothetical protein